MGETTGAGKSVFYTPSCGRSQTALRVACGPIRQLWLSFQLLSQQPAMTTAPCVAYKCACTNALEQPHLPPIGVGFDLFPLHNLLFCIDCNRMRCPSCTTEEVSCYYCPNCMFEVPSASVKTDKGCCGRNCFQCPICTSTLSIVAGTNSDSSSESAPSATSATAPSATSATTPTSATSAASPLTGSFFYMSCPTCRWDSQDVHIKFDRPTGLASQFTKQYATSQSNIEFTALREYYDALVRSNKSMTPSTVTGSMPVLTPGSISESSPNIASTIGLSSHARSIHHRSTRSRAAKKQEPYHPIHRSPEPGHDTDSIMSRAMETLFTDTPSLDQRVLYAQSMDGSPSASIPVSWTDLLPRRVPLRTRRTKRCMECTHILVKPEPKASSVKFGVKSVAVDRILHVRLVPPIPKVDDSVSLTMWLRVVNPRLKDVDVEMSGPDSSGSRYTNKVQIEPEKFRLSGFSDPFAMMDAEQKPTGTNVAENASTDPSSTGNDKSGAISDSVYAGIEGVAENGPHERIIKLQLDRHEVSGSDSQIQVPVHIKFSEVEDENDAEVKDDTKKDVSFWVVVCF